MAFLEEHNYGLTVTIKTEPDRTSIITPELDIKMECDESQCYNESPAQEEERTQNEAEQSLNEGINSSIHNLKLESDSDETESMFQLGSEFTSFEDITNLVEEYGRRFFVQMFMRDSLTLETARKTKPNRVETANKKLKYYRLTFACTHGGREFRQRGKGCKKSQTIKKGCSTKIRFSLTECGQKLKIVELNLEHNHSTDEESFKVLPKQRKLNFEESKEVQHLLNLRCDNKLVHQYIRNKTGKSVILRDIRNLKSRNSALTKQDLTKTYELLKEENGTVIFLVDSEDNGLKGIYFQDEIMKRMFSSYPEVIICDATKLNNLRMPLYLMVVPDGNGHCEIVCTFLLADESAESISEMISIFKKENPLWDQCKTVITDKDFTERKVFSQEFKNASLILCLFHVLKAFRNSITSHSMHVTPMQCEMIFSLLQKMAYSKNLEEYEAHYKELLSTNCQKVIDYFNKNWHNMKTEWVQGLKKKNLTFATNTTNHVGNLNKKIKQLCVKFSSIDKFFKDFLSLINVFRSEKDHIARTLNIKRPVHTYKKNSPEDKYSKFLTPYAFSLILKNLKASTEITQHEELTTETSCTCVFSNNMALPCHHIFAFRKEKNLDLFFQDLIHKRFRLEYYTKYHTIDTFNHNSQEIKPTIAILETDTVEETIYNGYYKYEKANELCLQIAALLSEEDTEVFKKSIKKLEFLTDVLNNHEDWEIITKKDCKNRVINGTDSVQNVNIFEPANEFCNQIADADSPVGFNIVVKTTTDTTD